MPLSGPVRLKTTTGETPRYDPLRPLTMAREVCRVSCRLPRCTVTGTGVPAGCFRITFPIWVQSRTGVPATAMILSPARTPACLAGESGLFAVQAAFMLAGTQVSMVPTVVALPAGLAAERPRLVGRVDVLQLGHADDLHEAARRERLDPVLGLALPG